MVSWGVGCGDPVVAGVEGASTRFEACAKLVGRDVVGVVVVRRASGWVAGWRPPAQRRKPPATGYFPLSRWAIPGWKAHTRKSGVHGDMSQASSRSVALVGPYIPPRSGRMASLNTLNGQVDVVEGALIRA